MSRFEGGATWVKYGPPGDEDELRFLPKEDNAIIFNGKLVILRSKNDLNSKLELFFFFFLSRSVLHIDGNVHAY